MAGILSLFDFLGPSGMDRAGRSAAGLMDGLEELRTVAAGIGSFTGKIAEFTSVIGIAVILLFLAILLISAGLGVLGVPRGKASFLMSLAIADGIWIAWKQSFDPGQFGYLQELLRSNLILLVPLLAVALVSFLAARVPRLYRQVIAPRLRRGRGHLSKNEMLQYLEEYQAARGDLERSLLNDIGRAGNEWVSLSPRTRESAKTLQRTLGLLSERRDGDTE